MIEVQRKKKALVGTVTSDKMQKTLVVSVSRTAVDRRFGKVLRTTKSYKAHYEGPEIVNIGDTVEIVEGRPVSKTKYMYVTKVIAKQHDTKRN